MARKSNGWVKIHSKILEENLTPSQFKFFVGSIVLANPPSSNHGGVVDLSLRQLSKALKMSRSEVWRRETELAQMEIITLKGTGFLINKYLYYQLGKTVPPKGQLRDTGAICYVCEEHELLPAMDDYEKWLAARFQEHEIIPLSMGGTKAKENVVILCHLCHKQAHHNQLSIERKLSPKAKTRLEYLQSQTVPPTGQLNKSTVPPTGLKISPTGQKSESVPPTGNFVPSTEAISTPKKEEDINEEEKKDHASHKNEKCELLNKNRILVFEGLKSRRGYNSPVAGAEAKAITWMLGQGYSVGQVLGCYDALKKEKFWGSHFLSMQTIKNQIGEFQKGKFGHNLKNALSSKELNDEWNSYKEEQGNKGGDEG